MIICPGCQRENSPKARFCAGCGASFDFGGESFAQADTDESMATVESVDFSKPMPQTARFDSAPPPPPPAPRQVAAVVTLATQVLPASAPEIMPPAQTQSTLRTEQLPTTPPSVGEDLDPSASLPSVSLPPGVAEVIEMAEKAREEIGAAIDETQPVRVALNFNRVLVAGYGSVVEVQVENQTPQPIENLVVRFESRGLSGDAGARWKRIAPSQTMRSLVDLEPGKVGSHVLRITVQCAHNGQNISLRGTRGISINKEPDTRNIEISIGNIMTADGQNAGMGLEGNVSISNLIAEGAIKTVNDLINFEFPDRFQPLTLDLDWEISQFEFRRFEDPSAVRYEIPRQFIGFVKPAARLRLEPQQNSTALPLHLIAAPQFRIGRNRQTVDYAAWFWPRSEENDERTRNISREHVLLWIESGRLLAKPLSANGTNFEGEPIDEGQTFEIGQRGALVLGNEYHLDVSPFVSSLAGAISVTNDRTWSGPADRPPSLRGAVRFTPLNTERAHHVPAWIFTDATFGRSQLNTIVFDHPSAADSEGRILFYRGQFWVEGFANSSGVQIDGYRLKPGELAPLCPGQRLTLAGTAFRIVPLGE